MSIVICVKTTCFDAIQLYIILRKLLRNMCNFLRSTPIENKYSLERLLLCFLGVLWISSVQIPQVAACENLHFLSFFFLFRNHTD